jgi:hypothetical protein
MSTSFSILHVNTDWTNRKYKPFLYGDRLPNTLYDISNEENNNDVIILTEVSSQKNMKLLCEILNSESGKCYRSIHSKIGYDFIQFLYNDDMFKCKYTHSFPNGKCLFVLLVDRFSHKRILFVCLHLPKLGRRGNHLYNMINGANRYMNLWGAEQVLFGGDFNRTPEQLQYTMGTYNPLINKSIDYFFDDDTGDDHAYTVVKSKRVIDNFYTNVGVDDFYDIFDRSLILNQYNDDDFFSHYPIVTDVIF